MKWIVMLLTVTLITGCATSQVFYLDAKEGACYRYAADAVLISGDEYKHLRAIDCGSPHHIKMIGVMQLPFANVGGPRSDVTEALKQIVDGLNTQVVSAHCQQRFEEVMGVEPPSTITPGATYLRWFYPDPGAERQQYGGTTACYIHRADDTYQHYQLGVEK